MAGWLIHLGRPILVPVFAAVLIVFVIKGLSGLLGRAPRLDGLPEWTRDLIATAVICAALIELVGLIATNVGAFAGRALAYQEALLALYQRIALYYEFDETATLAMLRAEAAQALNLPGLARSAAGSALGVVAVLIFVLLNVGFMMTERSAFARKLDRLGLAPDSRARVGQIIDDINDRVGAYLAMKTLMNLALGVLSWLIMLAFGVEFAVVFAIVIAVLNYIPYFGSFIGVAFPAAAALVTFEEPAATVWLVLCLAGAQFLIGNILEPQVMGNSLNLSPWVILIALTAWGAVWGVAGAVFSVPITAIMMVLRFNAGPVIQKFGPLGLLAICSGLAIVGLYLLSFADGLIFIFVAATVYGVAKTYFWPTMLGVVSEQTPKGGALTLNAIAGIGMLTVGILGGPFIGFLQESSVTSALEEEMPEVHALVIQENDYLLGHYSAVNTEALHRLPGDLEAAAKEVIERETQGALARMATFPAFMLVCYIGLILYFRSKGGYKPKIIGAAAH